MKYLSVLKYIANPRFTGHDEFSIPNIYKGNKELENGQYQNGYDDNTSIYQHQSNQFGVVLTGITPTGEFKVRVSPNSEDWNELRNISRGEKSITWDKTFNAPELTMATKSKDSGGRTFASLYIKTMIYTAAITECTKEEFLTALEESVVEFDSLYDFFSYRPEFDYDSKRNGNLAFINGMDNGVYLTKLEQIRKNHDDNYSPYGDLMLSAYLPQIMPYLTFDQCDEVTRLIRGNITKLGRASSWTMDNTAAQTVTFIIESMLDKVEELKTQLLSETVRDIQMNTFLADETIQENSANGAIINIVLPMTTLDWGAANVN